MVKNKGENYLGNVIRIIDEKSLIIDVGDDYLSVGDKVAIYTTSDDIKDLEGNSLGVFEVIKNTLEVTQTAANYSVCKNIVIEESNMAYRFAALTTKKIVVAQDLNIDKNEIDPLTDVKNPTTIVIGDFVRKA